MVETFNKTEGRKLIRCDKDFFDIQVKRSIRYGKGRKYTERENRYRIV